MKQLVRRMTAFLLATALLGGSALASYALGDELHGYNVPLAEGASLNTQMFWSNSKSDLRTENYITYKPHSSLSPKVSYGSSVLSKRTVAAMATELEKQGHRVLSGINGDYFVMATGDPLGIVLTDGILRSSASYLDAIGFFPDGSAIVGKPDLSITANFLDNSLKVADINKVRTNAGYYLLSSDFSSTTQNTQAGIDVVLAPVQDNLGATVTAANGQSVVQSDVLKIGSRISCVVEQVIDATSATAIPQGKFVMTINKKSGQYLIDTLASLKPGDKMDIDITSSDPRWNQIDCAIGALYRIVTDGKVNTGLDDATAPRTAVGVKADGTVLFYTIDGRQSGLSLGASMTQVANRLLELGCVNAVCLDGGGSTTIGVTDPGSNGFEVTNSPSDGTLRQVSNALFLVSNLSPSGVPSRLFVEPENRVLLSGGSTSTTASFVDTNWYPVAGSEAFTYQAAKGTVSPEGIYTAPASGGVDTITVSSASGLSGSTTVTVFQTPTSIKLSNETTGKTVTSLSLAGKESVNLRASASYKMIPLTAQDQTFQWSVTPATLGTISSDGVFTAGTTNGSGSITVSAGGYSASIPLSISVQSKYKLIDNFESSSSLSGTDTVKLTTDTSADQVRFGQQSLRADYTLSGGSAQMTTSSPLTEQDQVISLWVYGDQSGNQLSITVRDSAEAMHSIPLGTLDFSGWKRLTASIPSGSTYLTGLSLSGTKASGTIWLDHLLASNTTSADATAPEIDLSVNGTQLTAIIADNTGASFSKDQLTLRFDGVSQTFSLDGSTLRATLPINDSVLHRVSVTASDPYGNLARASKTLGTSEDDITPFLDMKEHWAIDFTNYLATRGIVKGEVTNKGTYFYPDRSITRGDFALMTARWIGLDLNQYASVSLPFADKASIPTWSLDAVKAMYSLGIMKGTSEQGKLYANAKSPITRAEAMTILGRIQPKGYPEASLSSFTDAATVPSWSKSYLSSLVGQGVVGGFEGKLRPMDSVSRAELCKMLFTLW